MRTVLAYLSLAAGIGLACCQSAAAFPVGAGTLEQAATAASGIQSTQYAERHGHHHITKCYREFVVGHYVCRRYHNL
jgi:hypothetical protein